MKVLSDAQTSQPLVDMLLLLKWDVETVHQHQLSDEKDDWKIVAYARGIDRVFLTFDRLRHTSGVQVAREIRENGGKAIIVAGGPDQPIERAIGKLLFHQADWFPFLTNQDGRVFISDINQSCRMVSREQLHAEVRQIGMMPFVPYLEKRAKEKSARHLPRPRAATPPEESQLELEGTETSD
ncbi:MAG: hypothetical protein EPO26_13420 [Chloroflexota bacterium]|nr:MAG: hypothetical protein EPO26_13420 [Chloroflexota bacterium]